MRVAVLRPQRTRGHSLFNTVHSNSCADQWPNRTRLDAQLLWKIAQFSLYIPRALFAPVDGDASRFSPVGRPSGQNSSPQSDYYATSIAAFLVKCLHNTIRYEMLF